MALVLRNQTWFMKFQVKGVKVYESTKTSIRRDAERIMAKKKAEIVEQVVLAGETPVRLHKAINEFVASRAHLASATNCTNRMARFLKLDDKFLHLVTDKETQEVIETLHAEGYKKSTISVTVNYWNSFIAYCKAKKYSTCGRLASVKGVKGKTRWLTDAEEVQFFNSIAPRSPDIGVYAQQQDNYDLCKLLSHTGARYSEIADMLWTQVDLTEETIFIIAKKDGVSRTLHMTDDMKEIFNRRRSVEPGEQVFSAKAGKHNDVYWMQRAVKRAELSGAGGSVTHHTFRHSRAVKWLMAGLNLLEVKEMLGHRSIDSTLRYLHLVPSNTALKAREATQPTQVVPVVAVVGEPVIVVPVQRPALRLVK